MIVNNKTKELICVYTPYIISRTSLHDRYRNILISCGQYNYTGTLYYECNKKRFCIDIKIYSNYIETI